MAILADLRHPDHRQLESLFSHVANLIKDPYCFHFERNDARCARYEVTGSKSRLDHRLQSYYGITVEDRDNIIKSQNNRCAICLREFNNDIRPCIDHCHDTGEVRGILCNGCNMSIGRLGTVDNIKRAVEYLSREEPVINARDFSKEHARQASKNISNGLKKSWSRVSPGEKQERIRKSFGTPEQISERAKARPREYYSNLGKKRKKR